MIISLKDARDAPLAALAYANRPYAVDDTHDSTVPSGYDPEKDAETFDKLGKKVEEDGDEKLQEKLKKNKKGKKKEEDDDDPFGANDDDDDSDDSDDSEGFGDDF